MPLILPFDGVRPAVDAKAFVAPAAVVVGRVSLGEETSIWYGIVLRGDGDTIAVGAGSNIQDGCVVHTDPGFPVRVGTGVQRRAPRGGARLHDR